MADNYDRLPEESLAELRRKYLRSKPLYGKAPTRAAYAKSAPRSTAGNISTGVRRYTDGIMTLFSLVIAVVMIFAPVCYASGSGNYLNVYETYSVFKFFFGDDGFFNNIGALNNLEAIGSVATAIALVSALITCIVNAIRIARGFFDKNSDVVRYHFVIVLIEIFSYHAWLGLLGREQLMGDYSSYGFFPSEAISTVALIAGICAVTCAIISYVKGFRLRPSKKPAWWSSAILTGFYSVIAIAIVNTNLHCVILSIFYAMGSGGGSGYSASNSDFEIFLIMLFNAYIIFAFFKMFRIVKKTLSVELNCLLGFGAAAIKMSPAPKTRFKQAFLPVFVLLAISVLGNGMTGIGWNVPGLLENTYKILTMSIAIWIACKVLEKKTRCVFL